MTEPTDATQQGTPPTTPPVVDSTSPAVVPAPTPAAPAASQPGAEDWQARFNGLMSMHNQQRAAWEAEKATLISGQQAPAPASAVVPLEIQQPGETNAAYENRLAELEGYIAYQELETAKAQAITAYPQLAPFAKYLVADSAEDLFELAQELAETISGPGPAAPVAPAVPPSGPVAPVLPGSPPYVPATNDALVAAKEEYRQTKNPQAFERIMQLKAEAQAQAS